MADRDTKMSRRELFNKWLDGDLDLLEHITDTDEQPELSREKLKEEKSKLKRRIDRSERARAAVKMEQEWFGALYLVVAVVCCVFFIGVLLFTVSKLPRYGTENPQTVEVVRRYIESGLEETGSVNIVTGIILDYRAFDTLGESHVLFTALVCVMILLKKDSKNMSGGVDSYNTIRREYFYDLSREPLMRVVGTVMIPCIFVYGIYVLVNGQNGPGGGFSGGTVLGTGLIMTAAVFGFETVDRVFTAKVSAFITVAALGFYGFAKGYVFFTGANGLENHIPKGTPGAILSGGLILPLDIAVGLVVMTTMFGFYSLFRRGNIGGE